MDNDPNNTMSWNRSNLLGLVQPSEHAMDGSTGFNTRVSSAEQRNNKNPPVQNLRSLVSSDSPLITRLVPRSRLDMEILTIKPMNYAAK